MKGWSQEPVTSPPGIELRDPKSRWMVTFTRGARTVRLAGPRRTFDEPTARPIEHSVWVRILPAPFAGTVDDNWLRLALDANAKQTPDVLAIAMQYVQGAAPIFDGETQIAGDASYGPPTPGSRAEGSDFYDYLGVSFKDPDGKTHRPRDDQFRCIDCSGFMRMTWGFRHSLPGAGFEDRVPLGFAPRTGFLPRRAVQIEAKGPGVSIIAHKKKTRPSDLGPLKVGDLVFFDADSKDGTDIDHVGLFMGKDADAHHRFVSSRKSADGPTLGDFRQPSILDGDPETDLFTRSFRAARRL